MEVLGQTIDDAAGEAFDKCAKVMGLPYPGGPIIDKLAAEGNNKAFKFAKPHVDGYNYSFSGLKTSFLYTLRDALKENPNFIEENKADLAASRPRASRPSPSVAVCRPTAACVPPSRTTPVVTASRPSSPSASSRPTMPP